MISRRDCLLLSVIGLAVPTPLMAESWRTYRNPRFGTTIEYPDWFRPGRPPDNGDGLGFSSADGAVFSVWGSHNALEHDLSGLETFTRENLSKDQRVTYAERGANWFVLSGSQGNKTFYQRYLLSHRQRIVNGFQISYPSRLNVRYDPIVRRMSRSLRAGRGMDTEGNP
jgi:hypothetical protein